MRFGVSGTKERALERRMEKLGIVEADLVERFVRASGPGGQNVNKVSTAVYLKHAPSGIEVKAQAERSQTLNRYRARQVLADKYETMVHRQHGEEQARIAKLRRQKRRRSRRAQEKVLQEKRRTAEKKGQRGRTGAEE